MIFLSFKEMISGSFKSELYKIPFFLVDTEGWYIVSRMAIFLFPPCCFVLGV